MTFVWRRVVFFGRFLDDHPWIGLWLLTAFFGSLFSVLQSIPTTLDTDGFYHAAIAQLLADGIAVKTFVWLPETVIASSYADHHFLYHVALVPFVRFFDPMVGMKVSVIVFGVVAVGVYFWALREFRVSHAVAWTLLSFTTYSLFLRLNAMKALPVGIVLFFVGLVFLVRQSWGKFIVTQALFVLSYGAWPILTSAAVFAVWVHREDRRHLWRALGSAVVGVVLGVALHPNAGTFFQFFWWQTVRIALSPAGVFAGGEWYPHSPASFLAMHGWMVLLGVCVVVPAFFVFIQEQGGKIRDAWRAMPLDTKVISILVLALLLMTGMMRRYAEYFIPAFALFVALVIRDGGWQRLCSLGVVQRWPRHATAVWILLLGIIVLLNSISIAQVASALPKGFRLTYLRETTAWMRSNLPPNTIVFNAEWVDFSALFLGDRTHQYAWGLDPRFLSLTAYDLALALSQSSRGDVSELPPSLSDGSFVLLPARVKEKLVLDDSWQIFYVDEEAILLRYR